ncbi:MAG: hypothetical protein KC543_07450 [Myxococcales bacterium]|nr:hypothetical protein [Myxococcales bacterium]
MAERARSTVALVVVTAIAVPAALVFALLVRQVFSTPGLVAAQDYLGPRVEPLAWWLVGATVLASLLGFALQRWLYRRAVARLEDPYEGAERAGLGALLIASSVPQLPALAVCITYMLGGPFEPAFVGAAISLGAVLIMAVAMTHARDA